MSGWVLLILGVLLMVMTIADVAWGETVSVLRLVLGVVLAGMGLTQVVRRRASAGSE